MSNEKKSRPDHKTKKSSFANVFDYLAWRGDLSFVQSECNEIDALIFSIFAYLDFSFIETGSSMPFKEAAAAFLDQPEDGRFKGPGFLQEQVERLLTQAAKSERFAEITIAEYTDLTDKEKEMQFSAVTFFLPDRSGVIAFRGTDNTLIGWKEDFNMSFLWGVPSQIQAAVYTSEVMNKYSVPFRMTGHSKGGNLAVWAAASLDSSKKEQLTAVYSNDGPGFKDEFTDSRPYLEIRGRIRSFVPESSIVGVLMNYDEFTTISSSGKSFLQHDPFSWNILGNHFVTSDSRSSSSRQMEKLINEWIKSMSLSEREEFVEIVFEMISSLNARTMNAPDQNKLKMMFRMQRSFKELDKEKQTQLIQSLHKIILIASRREETQEKVI